MLKLPPAISTVLSGTTSLVTKFDGGGGGEVAVLGEVGALEHLDDADGLRDQEVQIRIALTVRVAPQIDGRPCPG